MPRVSRKIEALEGMKKYPPSLYYAGDEKLLESLKVSIVGTRKPSQYTRTFTHLLASAFAKAGVCVVSGGAIGVDAIAHLGAGASRTIAVLPCGIEHKYPAINKNLLTNIEKEGLLLSQFAPDFKATPWSFVTRNELVVALGEILIVTEANEGSGSMRSIEYALDMKKEIYVLPHRVQESSATNKLLAQNKAKGIYDIEGFVASFLAKYCKEMPKESWHAKEEDPFRNFCKTMPTYEELLKNFPSRVFEAELSKEIIVKNGKVFLA